MWQIIKKLLSKERAVTTKFPGVAVGLIRAVKPHPQADRLKLTEVELDGRSLNIVCGADNIEPGQKVPVAMVGAVLPNGMAIKPAVIRGQASEGMLCAEDELGLGADHTGILLLNQQAKVGDNIDKYLK